MNKKNTPRWFQQLQDHHPVYMKCLDELGASLRKEGPLEEKTAHLVQLSGAAANRSEGAVHSHARQLLELGASSDEINHAIILLTSTIGFPAVSAALSWINDIVTN